MSPAPDLAQLHARVAAEIARIDSPAAPVSRVDTISLVWARDASEAIAGELTRGDGPALDAWYAAGEALLLLGTVAAGFTHRVGPGSCAHSRALHLQTNLIPIVGALLIDRSGGLR